MQIATEMGDPSAGAKIEFPSLPFGGKESVEGKQDQEGPEILAATVTREGLEDRQNTCWAFVGRWEAFVC